MKALWVLFGFALCVAPVASCDRCDDCPESVDEARGGAPARGGTGTTSGSAGRGSDDPRQECRNYECRNGRLYYEQNIGCSVGIVLEICQFGCDETGDYCALTEAAELGPDGCPLEPSAAWGKPCDEEGKFCDNLQDPCESYETVTCRGGWWRDLIFEDASCGGAGGGLGVGGASGASTGGATSAGSAGMSGVGGAAGAGGV